MADDLDTAAVADAVFMADIDDPDYKPEADDDKKDDEPGDDATDDKADDNPGDDDKDDKKDDKDVKPDKMTELETKLSEAQKEINRLGYALRKDKKPEKEKETPFTKAQLMQLYKEHSDNPEVVFQILEEMQKQGKVDATVAAEKSLDIKTKKMNMDTFIEGNFPEAKIEGSELYNGIQKAIEWAHLEGHPFAEHLAFGLLTVKNLPETIKKIKEDTKAEALKTSEADLSKKAEEARKKGINAVKPSKTGKSDTTNTVTLTAEQKDSAKRLGFTTKEQLNRYAKILGVKGGTVHAEA